MAAVRTGGSQEEYLTVDEAARLAGFSPQTIRRWAREGLIPSVTIDGRRWFRRKDIEAVSQVNDRS